MIPHSKPWISPEDINSISMLLSTASIDTGIEYEALVNDLQNYFPAYNLVTTRSGSDALGLILSSIGICRSDEVIVTNYVCHEVLDVIHSLGAKPVLVDIESNWSPSFNLVKEKITIRTKAIIFVHIFGIKTDLTDFNELDIPLIEDRCQLFSNEPLQGFAAAYSLNATKYITSIRGGLAVFEKDIHFDSRGGVSFDDVSSRIARLQLMRIESIHEKRKEIARFYIGSLPKELTRSMQDTFDRNYFFRFIIDSARDFDDFQMFMMRNGVSVRRGVDELLSSRIGIGNSDFGESFKAFNRSASLPIYPSLQQQEMSKVSSCVNDYFTTRP